jgi:hypothetical protein
MRVEAIHAGELNRVVELFSKTYVNQSTNERVKNDTSLGQKRVMRVDVSGTEAEQGKLVALSVCKYIMRFDLDVLTNGTKYFIRDIDGDYEVNSVSITGPGRNRFLELKCSSRGED